MGIAGIENEGILAKCAETYIYREVSTSNSTHRHGRNNRYHSQIKNGRDIDYHLNNKETEKYNHELKSGSLHSLRTKVYALEAKNYHSSVMLSYLREGNQSHRYAIVAVCT